MAHPPKEEEDFEERLRLLESVLIGTVATPGMIHVQREMAKTIYGPDGESGIRKDVGELKLDRAKGLAWIAGAAFAGGAVTGFIVWLLKLL